MNWDNIRVFISVNRLGSIAKAADLLAINHSTVLRRLIQLEDELNVKLFSRSTAGYEITPAGEELLVPALAMETQALALQRQAASSRAETSGKLDIALPPAEALEIMPLLAQFRLANPHIELNLNAQIAHSDLNKLEAEVSIRFTNNPPEDYIGFQLLSLSFKVYTTQAYLEQHGPIKRLEDIQHWVIINVAPDDGDFERGVKTLNPNCQITMRCNGTKLAAEAVSANMGVSYLPEHIASRFDNIIELPIDTFSSTIGIWILTHKDLRFQPRVKSFIEFMREKMPLHYPQYALHEK
ncbi:MAG: LysR family transcriptional regulator [Pseudomonadales bacterium]|nr:LysR family transcriptional regulator [Pseudomonadales bacterium]